MFTNMDYILVHMDTSVTLYNKMNHAVFKCAGFKCRTAVDTKHRRQYVELNQV